MGSQPAIPAVATSVSAPQVLDDADLFAWLQTQFSNKQPVLVVYANHLISVCLDQCDAVLTPANPDSASEQPLKALAKAGLLNHLSLTDAQMAAATHRDTSWLPEPANEKKIRSILRDRDATFGRGRGKPISEGTKRMVWNAAGGRCMYRGCSADLTTTPLTTKDANIAYLAHIVASDPDGPRGCAESHALSDSPDNIMLMCDAHHRLIDRIDPAAHDRAVLEDMRKEHCDMVRNLLDGLSYPRAQGVTLLWDVANVTTQAPERDLRAAMHQQRTNPLSSILRPINRSTRDGRTNHGFWNSVLHEHENDFRELKRICGGFVSGNGAVKPERTAIFPLMTVPMLVLCGRIAGQASPIDVYQYDRDRKTWVWGETPASPAADTFRLVSAVKSDSKEVLLSVELTAPLDLSKLPQALQAGINAKQISWIRITHDDPNYDCIAHPDDLAQYSNVAAGALKCINDELRADTVHVVGVAPVSSLFRLGQMMQAGHHPDYIVYDRPNREVGFRPAIRISGEQATSAEKLAADNQIKVSLR